METETTGTTSVNFEVSIKKTNASGEVMQAMASGAKLTKADAGRSALVSEDWLTIIVEQSEKDGQLPKVTLNTHSKLAKADAGKGESKV